MEKLASTLTDSAREIVVSRLIDGPQELVFEAFTDPAHLDRWYGPNGFTITTHAFELRPGGTWDFTMHGPDGTDYPNWIECLEIAPPSGSHTATARPATIPSRSLPPSPSPHEATGPR